MLPLDHPDRIQITFDDRRLVANAGLPVKGGEKTCHWGGVKLYHLGGA